MQRVRRTQDTADTEEAERNRIASRLRFRRLSRKGGRQGDNACPVSENACSIHFFQYVIFLRFFEICMPKID